MIREVAWDGIHNARDLGGLPTSTGSTRFGRIFRMPRPDILSATGWAQLESAGVRTLVDLRNTDEIGALPMRPGSVRSVHRALEDQGDAEFMDLMGPFVGSPTYYSENLRRWPVRSRMQCRPLPTPETVGLSSIARRAETEPG
jgi:protein-tyrosine phosphatase